MSETPTSTPSSKPGNEHSLTGKVVSWLSYAAALIPGLYVADLHIRLSAYKNWAKRGVFKTLQAQDTTRYLEALESSASPISKIADNLRDVNELYRQEVRGVFHAKGLTNDRKLWKILTRSQRAETIIQFITVTGIAVGVIAAMTQSSGWQKIFGGEAQQAER